MIFPDMHTALQPSLRPRGWKMLTGWWWSLDPSSSRAGIQGGVWREESPQRQVQDHLPEAGRACWVGLPHSHPPHLSASHQFVRELPLPEVCKIIINVSLSCPDTHSAFFNVFSFYFFLICYLKKLNNLPLPTFNILGICIHSYWTISQSLPHPNVIV